MKNIWKSALYIPIAILYFALLYVSKSFLFVDAVVFIVLPGFIALYVLNLLILAALRFANIDGTNAMLLISIALFLFFGSWLLSGNVSCVEETCSLTAGFPLTTYETRGSKDPYFLEPMSKNYIFSATIQSYFYAAVNYRDIKERYTDQENIHQPPNETPKLPELPYKPLNLFLNFILYFVVAYFIQKYIRSKNIK